MKLSIVIPNYNGKHLLDENLPKVIAACSGCEIIVVDDASTDGSAEMLAKKFPQVELLHRPKNEGFSTAANDGVKRAKGELVYLLNSDAYPDSFNQESIEQFFKSPETFAVGVLQKSIENGKIVLRGRGIGSFQRGFLVHARGEVNSNTTLWVSGGAGVFRKSIWNNLGGLCSLYNPFYWEDIDLSYRAKKTGYKIYFETRNSVVHSQKEGSIRVQYSQNRIKEIGYRNQFFFVWLNISDTLYFIQHMLWINYHCVRALFVRDWTFFKGYIMALMKLMAVLKFRFIYGKLWKLSDHNLTIKD